MNEVVIQEKALELINEACCHEFPIDVKCIAAQKGYHIKIYSESRKLLIKLNLLQWTQKFKSFSVKHNDTYYIFVSDNVSIDEENHLIAHEIGHIVLHDYSSFGSACFSPEQEAEADRFALALIAPIPLLVEMHVHSVKKIRKITKLSVSDSKQVLNLLVNHRTRYSDIIKQTKTVSLFFTRRLSILAVSACAVVLLFCISFMLFFIKDMIYDRKEQTSSPTTSTVSVAPKIKQTESAAPISTTAIYYWTSTGKVYHSHQDCQALKNVVEINSGNLEEASKEKERLCKFCQAKDNSTDK